MKKKIKKNENLTNPCWPFQIDYTSFYAYWDNAFSKEECEKIVKIGKSKKLISGTVKNEDENKHKNYRDSKIVWLNPKDDIAWVYERCTKLIISLNERFFKFDLYGFNEFLQFTNYTAPGAKYGKHVDRAADFSIRKISMSIQLTDPSTYEGGELCLYDSNKGVEMDKAQGKLIIFPSYVLHEVKPVTKGERNSLVGWVTGSPFK